MLRVEHENGVMEVRKGQAVICQTRGVGSVQYSRRGRVPNTSLSVFRPFRLRLSIGIQNNIHVIHIRHCFIMDQRYL